MSNATIDPPRPANGQRLELLAKLLRRALDQAAPGPEALNSAEKFLRVSRADNITFEQLAAYLADEPQADEPDPPACRVIAPAGKYAGMTLAEIAVENLAYIAWMSREWKDRNMRDAADTVLQFFTGGDR